VKARVDPWSQTAETILTPGGRRVTIVHPARSDDLISEEDYVLDERLPYWADIWPSSRVLADVLLGERDAGGKALLELGCGLGVVSLAATLAGFQVLATDYYEDALVFARHNVSVNTSGEKTLNTMLLNWREVPAEIGTFDYIVASDVLYEKEYGALLADLFSRLLREDGIALMADPGRIAAAEFLTHCEILGLRLIGHERAPIVDAERNQTIDVYRFARSAR
jgi:predicted nicotinamide N-methyase